MPGIADAISAAPPRCGAALRVPLILASMPDDLRALAEQLLASERSDQVVADGFHDEGYPLSSNSVRNYRRANRLHRFAQVA